MYHSGWYVGVESVPLTVKWMGQEGHNGRTPPDPRRAGSSECAVRVRRDDYGSPVAEWVKAHRAANSRSPPELKLPQARPATVPSLHGPRDGVVKRAAIRIPE